MDEELLNKKIDDELKLPNNIMKLLVSHDITVIKQLCNHTKTELKNLQLTSQEINIIETHLQLLGLDLANNNY